MDDRSAVRIRALKEELRYYQTTYEDLLDTACGVIAQLHRGFIKPGEVVYIHPFDLSTILNELPVQDTSLAKVLRIPEEVITIKGITYKETTLMPVTTKTIG